MNAIVTTNQLSKVVSKPAVLFDTVFLMGLGGQTYFKSLDGYWPEMMGDYKQTISDLLKLVNDDNFLYRIRFNLNRVAQLAVCDTQAAQDMVTRLTHVRKTLTLWANGGIISYEQKYTPTELSRACIMLVALVPPLEVVYPETVRYVVGELQEAYNQRKHRLNKK